MSKRAKLYLNKTRTSCHRNLCSINSTSYIFFLQEVQVGGDLQVVKRLALQPISNNISASPREAKMSCRSDHLSTDTAKYPLKSQSLLMAESSSVFSKDFYPKSKEKSIQQSPVVKRCPFSNQSAVQQNGSFVRIQNSQVYILFVSR